MKNKRNKKNDTFHLPSFSKQKLRWLANLCSTIAAMSHLPHFITPILKSLVVPTASIKIFELTKSCIWAISNGCKKVVIETRVVQFLSEVRT